MRGGPEESAPAAPNSPGVSRESFGTGRLEAFSDGVFAIAITLLVLEISVPEADFDHLWRGIADQWPSYLGYATSFLTIGGLWIAHHGIFRRLREADGQVLRLNILLLMLVAFLPYPTKLVAEAIDLASAERAATIFYGANLLAISLVQTLLWRYVAGRRELLEPGVGDAEVAQLMRRIAPSTGFYVLALALSVLVPQVAAFGYLAIAVLAVLRGAPDRAAQPAT